MPRPTKAVVDLDCIAHNIHAVRHHIGSRPALMIPVKADAYGHGAVPVARLCESLGVEYLAVASVEEGAELRDAGITLPTVILGGILPSEAQSAVDLDLTASVCDDVLGKALSGAALSAGKTVPVFINIDTGMGRVGCHPWEHGAHFVHSVQQLPGIAVQGVFSHFPASDAADRTFAERQLQRFAQVRRQVGEAGLHVKHWSIANSGAIYNLPRSFLTLVRPGIMIYGYPPSPHCRTDIPLRTAMTFTSAVVFSKRVRRGTTLGYGRTYRVPVDDSLVVTVPVGYADGYLRCLSNRAPVLIGGLRQRIAGLISMDQLTIDLGPDAMARIEEPVVLFGRQGDAFIGADELADLAGSIVNEILCALSRRVPRVYVGDPFPAETIP